MTQHKGCGLKLVRLGGQYRYSLMYKDRKKKKIYSAKPSTYVCESIVTLYCISFV